MSIKLLGCDWAADPGFVGNRFCGGAFGIRAGSRGHKSGNSRPQRPNAEAISVMRGYGGPPKRRFDIRPMASMMSCAFYCIPCSVARIFNRPARTQMA